MEDTNECYAPIMCIRNIRQMRCGSVSALFILRNHNTQKTVSSWAYFIKKSEDSTCTDKKFAGQTAASSTMLKHEIALFNVYDTKSLQIQFLLTSPCKKTNVDLLVIPKGLPPSKLLKIEILNWNTLLCRTDLNKCF